MKIKIVHIQVVPIMSGVQQISFDILKNLDEEIYQKYIIVGEPTINSSDFFRLFNKAGVEVIIIPSLRRELGLHDLYVLKDIFSIMRQYKFDIVHTNSTKPAIFGRIAAKLSGIKKIVHTVHGIAFHSSETYLKRFIYYGVEVFSSFFGDFNISVNKFYLKYYSYLSKKSCFCIYNGVDFNQLSQNDTSNNYIKKTSCRILYMARLEAQKDPLTLLRAVKNLVDNYELPRFELWMGGGGELEESCKAYVREHSLEQYVRFLGWVTDKSDIYKQCDIFCVPSIYEAFGLVFAEAAFYRLPIVSTTVEGIPEVVLDNKSGYLVPPGNHIKLAEKLSVLITDSEKRQLFGENGYEHVTTHFPVEKMVEQYNEIYRL